MAQMLSKALKMIKIMIACSWMGQWFCYFCEFPVL